MRAHQLAVLAWAHFLGSCATARCEEVDENVPVAPVIDVAPGYVAKRVLSDLNRPTQIASDEDGRLYILEGKTDKRVRIFDPALIELGGFRVDTEGESTGLLVLERGRLIYVASRGRIDRFRGDDNFVYTAPELVVRDLPAGDHWNHNLKLGPDGQLYFGLGATCDVCDEEDERSAAILRFEPNVTGQAEPEIYARGLRNPYDLLFTENGELLAVDQGPDCCPKDQEKCSAPGADRLLEVKKDDHFGWPYIYRRAHDGEGMTIKPELIELGRFAGASGFVEYRGEALCEDEGRLFIALWGQRLGTDEGGRIVVRATLQRDGSGAIQSGRFERFLGPNGTGHPVGLAIGQGGRLYVLDALGFVLEVTTESGRCR